MAQGLCRTLDPLARLGEAMRRHRRAIVALQWIVVLFYLVLLTVPAFMPLPQSGARILSNLTLFAQFAFWGIWWPFVMLSMMLVGRVWCGVLCPEGALSEWASRRGLGRAIPRWMRWSGWPFVAFACTTVYGQLVSVYEYPKAALLVLGGSTVAAIGVGFVYGRGKRVWCRYLCPANGVFALLDDSAPWWLLTHYPEANDVFTWLDGLLIVFYILASALAVGAIAWLGVAGAARLVRDARTDWKVLALCLLPLAGASVFVGLSMLTLGQLRGEGITFAWVPAARAILLAAGTAWALSLGARRLLAASAPPARRLAALACFAVPPAFVAGLWCLPFYVW